MARRRSNVDLIGGWLWFVVFPWLLLAPFRLIRWVWRIMAGRPKRRLLPGQKPHFYRSRAWQTARIKCFERNIKEYGALTCELCGRTKATGVKSFHCHHLRSRSNWPELALDQGNLVAACEACNMGMGNRYEDLKLNLCRRKAA